MSRGAKAGGVRQCRYEQDVWIDEDRYLFIKLTAIEFERATTETFGLSARRRVKAQFLRLGVELEDMMTGRTNWLEVWDIARDWASDLPVAYTYRTAVPLPLADEDEDAGEAAA